MLTRIWRSDLTRTYIGTLSIAAAVWTLVAWFDYSQTGHWPHIWPFN
jgi:hypothetical protein